MAAAMLAPAIARAQLIMDPATAQVSSGGQGPAVVQSSRLTDITLGAPRTVLNWTSFDLAADQTVVYRFQDARGVVLNRVSGQAVIDGRVESFVGAQRQAGNVWFSAPGGVIFGPNARVDVGGLLATTASPSVSGFLDASGDSFAFSGGGAALQVRAGAELKSAGGGLALAAASISTAAGTAITSDGAVLYGAANDFTVRFSVQPGGLDLLDFVVPAGGGTGSATPLSLLGQTVGGHVFLAAVNRAEVAAATINAPGLIAAQSASLDRGDIVLTSGTDIVNRQPGTARGNAATRVTATFGVVSAQRDLLGGFASPTALSSGRIAAGRDLGVTAASLNLGDLNAGRILVLDAAQAITLRESAAAGSAATLRTSGALLVGGGTGSIVSGGRLQLDVGSVQAGQLVTGRSLVINAGGVGPAAAVLLGSILAGDDISIVTTHASGSIGLGAATIIGVRTDDPPAGRTLSLVTRGAGADIAFGGATGAQIDTASTVTISAGRDAVLNIVGPAAPVTAAAGRDLTLNVSGVLTLNGGSAGRDYTIRAGDLQLRGALSAVNLRVESLSGALIMGSSSSPSAGAGAPRASAEGEPGLYLTNAEFQNIQVSDQASFYAGSTLGPARGNLTVLDLRVNTDRIPRLLLAAGVTSDILVTGVLAPESRGGVLAIGEPGTDSPWRPGRILVTGAIGFATGSPDAGFGGVRPFNEVTLNAVRDVILGTPRFVNLVAAAPPGDIDVENNQPLGVAPTADERDRVFLTSDRLTATATERIVQQNTGTVLRPNGILITSQTGAAARGALSVTPARVVDLFGAFQGSDGVVADALTLTLGAGGVAGAEVRFNGCNFAAGACATREVEVAARKVIRVEDLDLRDPTGADGLISLPPEPPVLSFAEPEPDVIITDPVMLGTGSDEIWRTRRKARR